MHHPLFVYLSQHPWAVGSSYKYFKLLQQHYGGLLLTSPKRSIAVSEDFRKDLEELKPALAFCRGDWLQYWQLLVRLEIPYILIEQDIHSLRTNLEARQLQKEKDMIEKAVGVIFTSSDHMAYCREQYDIKNCAVVHLRPLLSDLAWHPKKKLKGKQLVYAGGLVGLAPGGSYGYRCYQRIFKAFQEAGWTVHVYPNRNQRIAKDAYGKWGCVTHQWLPYSKLLQEMSQYTAGLQAYARVDVDKKAFIYTQTCRPNKTWDYLASGIPTIGLYAGNCAKIYQEGGWGIVIPDTKRSTLENIKLPSFPLGLRFEQVMDDDIKIFEEVIDRALGRKPQKNRAMVHFEKPLYSPEGDEEKVGIDLNKAWYKCKKVVIEKGVILHGKGKRIPRTEAIRLGLVKKEAVVKEKIIRKRANKAKKDAVKKPVKKVKVKKESKPKKKEEVQKLHSVLVKREVIMEDKEKEGDE